MTNIPVNIEDLANQIQEIVSKSYSYEDAPNALAEAALLAFNFVASELGVSGYQASYADMVFLSKSRLIKGPFAIVKAEDMLYPQYDILKDVQKHLDTWSSWVAEEATRRLKGSANLYSPSFTVIDHWKKLAAQADK
jgi:hypothetical protein